MLTYLSDVIPKIQKFSQRLDDTTVLTGKHWISYSEIDTVKRVYIFRVGGELIVSTNGKVVKGKWEYLNSDSILIDIQTEAYLFRNGFIDDTVLVLKTDGREEFAFFVNESKSSEHLNSLDAIHRFLNDTYLKALHPDSSERLGPDGGLGAKLTGGRIEQFKPGEVEAIEWIVPVLIVSIAIALALVGEQL